MKLRDIFKWKQPELKKRLRGQLRRFGYDPISRDGFLYAKGELPVLLVAHLDTVHKEPVRDIIYGKNGHTIWSPQGIGGDDRCGVYMILKIIKELKCHVLFCEDEEIGGIGARQFTKSGIKPELNYIIEMDRRGSNDAVFYDCDNRDFVDFVTSFGFAEKWGSFSDISIVAPALGVAAVNISAGYYHEHTLNEYVDVEIMNKNIKRIKELICAGDTAFEYIEAARYGRCGQYESMYDWGDDDYWGAGYDTYYQSPIEIRKRGKRETLFATILANRIEDLMGYIITKEGDFYEEDVFVGYDNRIYAEYDDGVFCALDGASGYDYNGSHLRFRDECDVYELFVSDEILF